MSAERLCRCLSSRWLYIRWSSSHSGIVEGVWMGNCGCMGMRRSCCTINHQIDGRQMSYDNTTIQWVTAHQWPQPNKWSYGQYNCIRKWNCIGRTRKKRHHCHKYNSTIVRRRVEFLLTHPNIIPPFTASTIYNKYDQLWHPSLRRWKRSIQGLTPHAAASGVVYTYSAVIECHSASCTLYWFGMIR
jgi:hypothetical protein